MQLLKRVKWVHVILSLFLILMGVLLLMWPEIPSVTICCIIGAAAVLFGIIKIVFYFLRDIQRVGEQYDFGVGVICVIVGVILLIHPADVLGMIPQVLGLGMLIDSVFKLQIALDAKRLGNKGWWVSLLITVVCLAWGVILILRDTGVFGQDGYLSILIGGGLVADGVQNFVTVFFSAGTVKKTEATGKRVTEPAEPMFPIAEASGEEPVAEPVPAVVENEPVQTEEVKAEAEVVCEPAPAPEKKNKFSLFKKKEEKKEETAAPEPETVPAEIAPVEEPAPVENDGAVAEINFEMKEEVTK